MLKTIRRVLIFRHLFLILDTMDRSGSDCTTEDSLLEDGHS